MRAIALLISLALGSTCWAQSLPPQSTERVYVMKDDGVVGSMLLDTAQVSALRAIEADYQAGYDAVLETDTLNDAAIRVYQRALGEQRRRRMRSVLAENQYNEWLLLVEGRAAHQVP